MIEMLVPFWNEMLMPLQGDCLLALLPRALPWAMGCWPLDKLLTLGIGKQIFQCTRSIAIFRPPFGYMRIIIISYEGIGFPRMG